MSMKKYFRTRSDNGLRLRNSPFDGDTLEILPDDTKLTAVDEQTWVKVITPLGKVGYVLKDYLEPYKPRITPEKVVPFLFDNGIIQYRSRNDCITNEQPIRIHKDFEKSLLIMEEEAKNHELKLLVTSSLRSPLSPVGNAIVKPASVSNHHVGHAVDVNFMYKTICYGSRAFKGSTQIPDNITRFICAVCKQGLRWGGHFGTPDFVHFDDKLNINDPEQYQRKLIQLHG